MAYAQSEKDDSEYDNNADESDDGALFIDESDNKEPPFRDEGDNE